MQDDACGGSDVRLPPAKERRDVRVVLELPEGVEAGEPRHEDDVHAGTRRSGRGHDGTPRCTENDPHPRQLAPDAAERTAEMVTVEAS